MAQSAAGQRYSNHTVTPPTLFATVPLKFYKNSVFYLFFSGLPATDAEVR